MIDIKKELIRTARNSIRLKIGGKADDTVGATRFGGAPDVPEGFEWARYESESIYTNEVKERPLSFIAQFDLEEVSKYDTENLLPKTGVLSFFYELDSQKWGCDPDDKGCAKVYWFPDKSVLRRAEFPRDLGVNDVEFDYRLPALGITMRCERSYQDYGDFLLQREKLLENWEDFEAAQKSLGVYSETDESISKLLGWADTIQGNMTMECELVSRGYYLGDSEGWNEVTPLDRQEAKQWSAEDWVLLFQLDTVENGDFELMFGDCGRIYFYIRRDDLAARNFDDIWLVLQCG